MSLDSKIAILLSQLKNNPELQSASSTSPKVQSTTLSLEPLFAGLEENTPMLAGSASLINDPTFLNVELDLFVLLKEQITSTLNLIDIIAFSQDKAFRDVIDSREDVSKKAGKALRDVVEIDQFLQFLKAFRLEETISFKESQDFLEHKKFLSQLETLQKVSKETKIQKREVLDVLDELLDARVHKQKAERVGVRNSVLNPKGLIKTNRVGVISHPPKVNKRGSLPEEVLNLLIAVGLTPAKGFKESLNARISLLAPKARVKADRIFISDIRSFRSTFEKQDFLDVVDKALKRIELVKSSITEVRDNNLIARAVYNADKAGTTSFTSKQTRRSAKEVVDLEISKFFKVNRSLLEQYNIRDSIITPSKFNYVVDRLFSKTFESKNSTKPLSSVADTIVRTFINPNLATKEEIKTVSSVLTPKAKLFVEKLIFDEFVKLEMPIRLFTTINLKIQLAKFLNKRIILPEVAEARENIIATKARVLTDRAGVVSKDRDAGGIGDVSFLFATQMLDFLSLIQEVKKEAKKPRKEKIKIQDSVLTPRFKISASKMGITEESVIHFNKVPAEILQIDTEVVKETRKPILEKPKVTSFTLTPAIAQIVTERFLADDSFNPYLFNKVPRTIVGTDDKEMRLIQEKNGITDTLSSSQVGYAWMRDEEYTRGAYFLQPYVATIPPGRSRQF